MRLKLLVLLLLLSSTLWGGKIFTFQQLHKMPKSIEKDYYIWRFLSQPSTTKSQAERIIKGAYRLNKKLKTAYRHKTGVAPNPPKPSNPTKPLSTKEKKLKNLIEENTDEYPAWVKEGPQMECYLFNRCGTKVRKRKFDKYLNSREYRLLTMEKEFDKSIRLILKEDLPFLKRSLLQPPANGNKLTSYTHFRLGLHALRENKKEVAMIYFGQARKKAWKRSDKDRANFWLYLTSKDHGYLQNLLNSYHINIYTLIVRDMYKLKYPKTITPRLQTAKLHDFNIQDPIKWAELKKKIFSKKYDLNTLAESYKSRESIGHYSYIKEKASNYTSFYYPMPYRDVLSHYSKERQAMIYALAKQESRFVPASISTSFALGMMQIMPFLVKDIAKKKKETIDLDEMFNPYKALEYANFHLDYLDAWLYHPLFVAYAYNGGIGYTRRLIEKRENFIPGNYEPYISMEEMTNDETREYGKKVLTNYVIYLNKLGVPTRILPLIKAIADPEKTDRFRKSKSD